MIQTSICMKQKQNCGHRAQAGYRGGGGGNNGVGSWGYRCQLLYMEWINSKILLDSTESYIQYYMTNHKEKEYFKKE